MGFLFLPPSLLFPDTPVKPHQEQHGEERGRCVCSAGVFGVWGRALRRLHWQAQCPFGSSVPPSRMGQLAFLPPSLSPGYQILPSSLSCISTRRFPKAQGRVQHPDLNFNAILAPKASFCCSERKLIRKVLSAPALQDLGPCSALGRSSPCPAALPPAFQRGGSLCFDICYYLFFFPSS